MHLAFKETKLSQAHPPILQMPFISSFSFEESTLSLSRSLSRSFCFSISDSLFISLSLSLSLAVAVSLPSQPLILSFLLSKSLSLHSLCKECGVIEINSFFERQFGWVDCLCVLAYLIPYN